MGKTHSELISFSRDRKKRTTESIYHTEQFSKNTRSVVEQNLVIKGDTSMRQYVADMRFDDFPVCNSEREAALKLANWMQRLGAAIKDYWSQA
ncbi:hypothetical protein [Serratia sp. UGAL515B_01]|uniref:hypothetical protein n=1 Tax=Serratia sp. UGAL515B_01 TaxID=2986763 RepID=UPI002953AB11|nr:hypothetical protein [Serratia sp. UGAL515B_01]WON77535.1 hypothetical protein OK023_02180 [Serratia sp. UGAL515B_01]